MGQTTLDRLLDDKPNVNRLSGRADGFLQVLLREFVLAKEPGGLVLKLNVTDGLHSIVDRNGKFDLLNALKQLGEAPRNKIRQELRAFYENSQLLAYRFDCSQCCFRYANGGVLPIVRWESLDYFCLFFRDTPPIGWNIANGASDNLDELLDPGRVVLREFGEELLIFDEEAATIYAHDPGSANRPPGYQAEALQAWSRLLANPALPDYEILPIPLKWIEGPDCVHAKVLERQAVTGGYFLSVTPDDNAIEVDRFALINLHGNGIHILDGEIAEGKLLNRIVGLFKVSEFAERLSEGETHFSPDVHFFSGQKRDSAQWDKSLRENCMALEQFRSHTHLELYDAAPEKLNLCPITRAVIDRYYRWTESSKALESNQTARRIPQYNSDAASCQVFISYKSENTQTASGLYHFLLQRGYAVFCSSESLLQLGESDYMATINQALEKATCLVVIGDNPTHFRSGWVDYEWKSFLNELLAGRKRGEVFSFVGDLDISDLPYGLRGRQMVPFSQSSPLDSFEELHQRIRAAIDRLG